MKRRLLLWLVLGVVDTTCLAAAAATPCAEEAILDRLPDVPGIAVLLDPQPAELAIALAGRREWTIYCQLPSDAQVAAARQQVDRAGLLGTRIYVEKGPWSHIHLADNMADAVIVTRQATAASGIDRKELLRVVNPLGKVLFGDEQSTKPFPAGIDDWTHPYHGPDNNPQSRDLIARAPYLTQFFAGPYFMPPPSVSVAAGGRIFKAHGHLAFHSREWPWRNKLVAMNAFNGTILWTRPLAEGFNVHRNTLVATPTTVYLGDPVSCKRIHAATGALECEIIAPAGAAGPVWKWMGMEGGVLYGLVGEKEFFDPGHRKADSPPGWPWGGMSPGYDLPEYPWGFGRTFLAIDAKTGKTLWLHNETERIDSRGVSMTNGRIYYYSEQKLLACLDAVRGKPVWRTADAALLAAIGPTGRAQHYNSGMSTFGYMTSSDKAIYFLGPHRPRIVAASTADGRLLWQYPYGNFRPVLRDEGLYVMAPIQGNEDSLLLDPLTGKTLAQLHCRRVNCTRATGTVDGIFVRAGHDFGTGQLRLADNRFRRLPLMRPPCHDGVLTAFGLMHWGSWICDCNVSMIGNISLAPAGDFDFQSQAKESDRLETNALPGNNLLDSRRTDWQSVRKDADGLPIRPTAATKAQAGRSDALPDSRDWPTFRADVQCSAAVPVQIVSKATLAWTYRPPAAVEPAAPIAACDTFYWSGADGAVRAIHAASGELKWSAYTGGAIVYPPVAYRERLYVGSGDGWVYCFDADSGRLRWRFRAAPVERKIPIFGRLGSTWPVASGVVVDDGVVYAAAGIANYDGTHVYALDAETGKIRWQNNTSGQLAGPDSLSGVSVQGHLLLHAGKLYLAGGNAASPAVYDTRDGRCLNSNREEGKTACARGQDLFLIQDRVYCFDRRLYGPNRYWPGRRFLGPLVLAQRGEMAIRDLNGQAARVTAESAAGTPPKVVWRSDHLKQTYALALGANAVVVAGQRTGADGQADPQHAVTALAIGDGAVLWSHPLPAQPAWWGLAVDKAGRVFVTLVDGRALCLSASLAPGSR
jgi:outer membrane protein assembly factor BamB